MNGFALGVIIIMLFFMGSEIRDIHKHLHEL